MNKKTSITLLSMALALGGCSDKNEATERHNVLTDIGTIHNGLTKYQEFNNQKHCPSVAALIDTNFINHRHNQEGTLLRPISMYQITKVDVSQCEISIRMGENLICNDYDLNLPESIRMSCEQKNTLKLFVTKV